MIHSFCVKNSLLLQYLDQSQACKAKIDKKAFLLLTLRMYTAENFLHSWWLIIMIRRPLPPKKANKTSYAPEEAALVTTKATEWRQLRPSMTQRDALLLSAQELSIKPFNLLKLLDLPSHLLIYIAHFLCAPKKNAHFVDRNGRLLDKNHRPLDENVRPLEWLIMTALFQNFFVTPESSNQPLLIDETEQQQITSGVLSTFSKDTLLFKKASHQEWLFSVLTKEAKSLAFVAAANNAAANLTASGNDSQLSLFLLCGGTWGQINEILEMLLMILFNSYSNCKHYYDTRGKHEEYKQCHATTSLYLSFINNYFDQWIRQLEASPTVKAQRQANKTVEAKIVNRHSNYRWYAQDILENKCHPPHPNEPKCSIS